MERGSKWVPKWSEAIRAKLLEARSLGLSEKNCAGAAGIGLTTLRQWLDLGRRDHELWEQERIDYQTEQAQFYLDWNKVLAERQMEVVDTMLRHGKDDPKCWTACATWLERVDPESWARRQAVRIDQNAHITVKIIEVDGDEWIGRDAGHAIDADFSPSPRLLEDDEYRA